MRRELLFCCAFVVLGCEPSGRSATITIESKGDGLTVATACFSESGDFFCGVEGDAAVVTRGQETKLLEPPPGLQFLSETLEAQFDGDAVEGEVFEASWTTAIEGERGASVIMPSRPSLISPALGEQVSSKDVEILWDGASSDDEILIHLDPSCSGTDFTLEARDVKDDGRYVLPRRFFKEKDVLIPPGGCPMKVSISRIKKNEEIDGGTKNDTVQAIQTSTEIVVTLLP